MSFEWLIDAEMKEGTRSLRSYMLTLRNCDAFFSTNNAKSSFNQAIEEKASNAGSHMLTQHRAH